MTSEPQVAHLLRLLSHTRLPVSDEKALQAAIADVLTDVAIPFEREASVAGGVIDFLFPFGTGLEVKIGGSARDVLRQLEGYAEDERISNLILATSAPMAMPETIGGKRCTIVNLGRAWL